jgi:hypothetical protein
MISVLTVRNYFQIAKLVHSKNVKVVINNMILLDLNANLEIIITQTILIVRRYHIVWHAKMQLTALNANPNTF